MKKLKSFIRPVSTSGCPRHQKSDFLSVTNGNSTTVCYVKSNNDQLSTLINRPMIISGREYWVKRQNYPVLIPDRIVLKQLANI